MSFEHIFDQLDVVTSPFAVCELRGVSELAMVRDPSPSLHYILSGHGALVFDNAATVDLMPGTLVLVPALQGHTLRSCGAVGSFRLKDSLSPQCESPELNLQHLLKTSEGDTNGQVNVLCTHIQIGLRGAVEVIDLIRQPIVEQINCCDQMRSILDMTFRELTQPRIGSRAMIKALLTLCVMELLRRRLSQGDASLRWMAALRDPSVWEALRLMLDEPGEPHTVESLAHAVMMSRSAFAQRFTSAYGSGPIELLRDIRLRKAAALLRESQLPVKRIAQLVGFNSRSAFSRVFEQRTGQSPTDYRQGAQVSE